MLSCARLLTFARVTLAKKIWDLGMDLGNLVKLSNCHTCYKTV